MPSTTFNWTLVQNIKRDPFEQAVGTDAKSAMNLGGSLTSPSTAFAYDWNMLPIGQMIALRHLETYEAFPPMQTPPSYNLAQVMEQIRNQKRAIHNEGHPSD
jgi:arylsulfatase